MADASGSISLRAENYESMVKGFALQQFVMKELLMENSSSAWIETYYRETATELTGGKAAAVKGVPRLASFPSGQVTWTKLSSYIEKYGMEGVISWEDHMLNNIDVIARTLLRISRAVAYAVDTQIYSVLSAGAGQSVTITAGNEWDSATIANRDPIYDILTGKKLLEIQNFNPDSNGYLVLSPLDYVNLLNNSKVINNPTFKSADVVTNGNVGRICGLTIKKSNVVTADEALIVIAKECGTWKSAAGLTTHTIEDKGIKYTIRAYEMGVAQLTTPNAVCKISNTTITA